MAARAEALSYDRLHHFIGAGPWDSAPLEATLWRQADALVGGHKAWLIIDDTALPKKGKASVRCRAAIRHGAGKNANCQTLVSLTLASGEVPVMLGLRLFLPESWTNDAARMARAGVPEPFQAYRTKPDSPSRRSTASWLPCALWLCADRCRLWPVGTISAGAQRAKPMLGRRHSSPFGGLSRRRATDLPGGGAWTTAGSACARLKIPGRPCHARRSKVAAGQLASRNKETPDGALRRHTRADR